MAGCRRRVRVGEQEGWGRNVSKLLTDEKSRLAPAEIVLERRAPATEPSLGGLTSVRAVARRFLSPKQRRRLYRLRRPAWLGISRATKPISPEWGGERGTPIVRWYGKRFLDTHAADIKGHVLEVRNTLYSSQYPDVTKIDILDIDAELPEVTIVADLASMPQVPSDTYDCVILTSVLYYLPDVEAALREVRRVLHPGGVLLSVHAGIPARLTHLDGFENEFGYLSTRGTTTLFTEVFGEDYVQVEVFGNVLACVAFLRGVAAEEVGEKRLLERDDYFPQTIAVRALKSSA
jgi:SAM-dependent methyltransferase